MHKILNYRYNFFLILRNVIPTFQHAEWSAAYRKAGLLGTMWEGFRSLVGTNTWPFFIESKGDWDRKQIQQLLISHGVTMWGWGYSRGNFMFRVKKQQAYWAEYLMLKNGVPVTGRLLHTSRILNAPKRSKIAYPVKQQHKMNTSQ
ncbi:MAG: hypothetical protein EKK57_06665 [Proteobacteria bacterium]|nr:MAG: hypothetical protein EKK57_06665 [Pseudomonadota bacterium]